MDNIVKYIGDAYSKLNSLINLHEPGRDNFTEQRDNDDTYKNRYETLISHYDGWYKTLMKSRKTQIATISLAQFFGDIERCKYIIDDTYTFRKIISLVDDFIANLDRYVNEYQDDDI